MCATQRWTPRQAVPQPRLQASLMFWLKPFLGTKRHITFALYLILSAGSNLHRSIITVAQAKGPQALLAAQD